MEDIQSIPLERENYLLAVGKTSKCAATQTPEMPRHPITISTAHKPAKRNENSIQILNPKSSLVLKADYGDSGLEYNDDARALSVPDVVIEHVKDNVPLKEIRTRRFEDVGMQNLAFDSSDELSQSPSRERSAQETTLSIGCDSTLLLARPNQFAENLECDLGNFPTGPGKRRLYYSLPRTAKQNQGTNCDIRMYSQPPSPKAHHSVQTTRESVSQWPYFTHPSPTSSGAMPSPDLSYRTLENGAGVYTISGRRTVVSYGVSDNVFIQDEKHFSPPTEGTNLKEKLGSSTRFELTPMPDSANLRRRRLQCCTDSLSLFLVILGFLMVLATPALLVPLFSATRKRYLPLIAIFIAGGTLSALILSFSGIIGNIVWNYDEKDKKIKMRMHCGKGPIFHFWANGLYHLRNGLKNREMIV